MAGMFDYDINRLANLEKSAMSYANLPRGRVSVAGAAQAGGMLGGGIMTGLGFQTPEQQKQELLQKIMSKYQYSDRNDPSTYLQMANELMPIDTDMSDQAIEIYKQMQPKAATIKAQQEDKEFDNTISYLERQYGKTLTEEQKSYLKARAKKDVSVTAEGFVVDTLPILFEQLVTQQPTTDTDGGLGVTKTEVTKYKATKEDERVVRNLSKDLAPIVDMETQLGDMFNLLSEYTDESGRNLVKDVPGIGITGPLQTMTSDKASKIKTQWNAFIGKVRNELFGSVLTTGETAMFESMLKPNSMIPLSDQDMMNFIVRLENVLKAKRRNFEAQATDQQLDLYRKRESRGKEETLLPKIIAGVKNARNAGANDESIKQYIIKKFNLTSEQADKYLGAE